MNITSHFDMSCFVGGLVEGSFFDGPVVIASGIVRTFDSLPGIPVVGSRLTLPHLANSDGSL